MDENKKNITRRSLLESGMRGACLLALGGVAGFTLGKTLRSETVWQIDPSKCVACGNCATYCVLKESAVKCVHSFSMCGYCELCTGFFDPEPIALDDGRYGIVRLDSVTPEWVRDLSEVSEVVDRRMREIRKEEAFQVMIDKWKQDIPVTVHEENLADLASWKELTTVELPGVPVPR